MTINNSGEVGGFSYRQDTTEPHAFLYYGSEMHDLGTLGGTSGDTSEVNDVNSSGVAVGSSTDGTAVLHAFAYNGSMVDLGTLGGSGNTAATGINSAGQIVGTSNLAPNVSHAVMWENGGITDLGTLYGAASSGASAVNGDGQVVGNSDGRAFLYAAGDISNPGNSLLIMNDLNNLIAQNSGWLLQSAVGINNHGQIIGAGSFNGVTHYFMLTPQANLAQVVVGSGTNQTASLPGRNSQEGATTVLFEATSGGTFTAADELLTASGLESLANGTQPNGSPTAPGLFETWDLSYAGSFTGPATVTFDIDPSLASSLPIADLAIEHFTDGGWASVPSTFDEANDAITFDTDSFSPFALVEVPEPSSVAIVCLCLAPALCRSRRR